MEKVVATSTVRQIGNSLGFIVPKKMVDKLNIKVKDFVIVKIDEQGRLIFEKESV